MAPEDPEATSLLPGDDPGSGPAASAEGDSAGLVGKVLAGRYRVGKRLGQGGMGSVYLATDLRLDREVVVKVPHAALLLDSGFRQRFAGEIQKMTRLEHPNVLQIHDVGENDGVPFAVVQYLKGGDLADRIEAAGGVLAAVQVLDWLPRVASTLDYVHAEGYLHRDVSPGNIIFDDHGNAYLSDFGIATALTANDPDGTLHEFSNLTKPGGFVGAAAYAPPESIERKLNPGYDQYSLGVVVYEALSGELPFTRGSSEAMLVAKNTSEPTPLSQVAPHVPKQVAAVVMRAISRKPDDRYSSSAAFAEAFQAALGVRSVPHIAPTRAGGAAGTEVVAARDLAPASPGRSRSRRAIAFGAVLVGAAVLGGLLWLRQELSDEIVPALPEPGAAILEEPVEEPVGAGSRGATFQAGSTPAEKTAAYELCVEHLGSEGCRAADYADETPRQALVGPVQLDGNEVTNSEFAAWVARSGHRTTAEKQGYSWNAFTKGTNLSWQVPTRGASSRDLPRHPVVHVSRSDAEAFCRDAGKRLPTEDEWEYAARSANRRAFPWGDDWDPKAAVWSGVGATGAAPVGSRKAGVSWGGLSDMAGNVWEWTSTDVNTGDGPSAVLKGGSWLEANPANLRGAARLFESADYTSSDAGFRCVEDR